VRLGYLFEATKPAGHGPLPNTIAYADVFNRISQCINLLTMVRVDMPLQLESRLTTYEGETTAGPGQCVENAGNKYFTSHGPGGMGTVTVGAWVPGLATVDVSAGAAFSAGGAGTYCDGSGPPGAFRFLTAKQTIEFATRSTLRIHNINTRSRQTP
jgi:hypothetical protein